MSTGDISEDSGHGVILEAIQWRPLVIVILLYSLILEGSRPLVQSTYARASSLSTNNSCPSCGQDSVDVGGGIPSVARPENASNISTHLPQEG